MMSSFSDFALDPAILKSLDKMGYKDPSPIQAEAIPHILAGRDIIALAQTGSGKTAACMIPICHQVDLNNSAIQTLVVVPTRELALQYAVEAQKIGKERGVKAFALFGGEDPGLQQAKLKAGAHVLVATPGRLIDFIYSRSIDLTEVRQLILDEADEMLSMGFDEDLEFIIQCLIHSHQTLLFSATMPQQIRKLARTYMQNPLEITLNIKQTTPNKILHQAFFTSPHHKEKDLIGLIEKLTPKQAIVFCASRDQCERVSSALKRKFPETDYLHAGMSQDLRRLITNKFRNGKIQYLVATDVAARGLDFSNLSHVFLYELPEDPEVYVHRAGRTGRAEREGHVVSLVTERQFASLKRILKLINQEAEWIGAAPDSFHKPPAKKSFRPKRPPKRV